jgi:hypothetical protein
MTTSARVSWGRVAAQALLAGLAGAVIFELYLWATSLLPHGETIGGMWQWIASTVLGKSALADPGAAATGAVLHVVVSIGWAAGYVYIAVNHPATTRRWFVAGIVYGLIVYTIMQVILLADGNFIYPPTPNAFINDLIAHALFFGVPVAFVVRALQSRPA